MNSEIKVIIPNNNIDERKYIINIFLQNIIGLNYSLELSDEAYDYILVFNERKIIIKDCFWKNNLEPLSYLSISNFPKVHYTYNQFIVEENIPVLYGKGEVDIFENEICCGIDVFAASFFMLTRWEEYINKERDKHNRFPALASVAFKNNFLSRPIVNEYAEMLWNMLLHLGYKGVKKEKKFEIILTHDVDLLKSPNPFRLFLGDILKRKSFKLAIKKLPLFFHDPVNTFSFLMDVSESIGVKSRFYFMAVSPDTLTNNPKSYLGKSRFKTLITEIIKRDHVIGFHPGYFTFDNKEQWISEKKLLENSAGINVYEGRQHFLKFDITKTLNIWDEYGMKMDCTLGYADKEGYRCGTGDSFNVFDFLNRKTLKLIETPLVLMDGSLTTYQSFNANQGKKIIEHYLSLGRKYKMKTVLLFHNSSFDSENWKGWKKMYRDVLIDNKG
ncbi:MAG: hypothetical protein CUR34_00850 [Sediminibacterium sp.]|nr:MAG: hypothetical protein CUR34_00850 [Sediminibacterium sp.] [Sediminibacterium sp. FEMGT703S]